MKLGARQRTYCNTCKSTTNQELRAVSSRGSEHLEGEGTQYEHLVFFEEYEYRFWVCLGCDTGTLEESYRNSEWEYTKSTFSPRREDKSRALQKDYRALGRKLWPAYKEVIESFNVNLPISCSVGLRALLEGICVDQGIPDKGKTYNLTGKLKALKKQLEVRGDLPPKVAEALDCLKQIGDGAAHRLEALSERELEQTIDFIESLIEFIYRIEYRKTVHRLADSSQRLADG